MAFTLVDANSVNRLSGEDGTTFTFDLPEGVVAGDTIVMDMLVTARGVTAPTGLPAGAVNLAAWSSPPSNAVTAGTWRYTVPATPPASITLTFAVAVQGSLLWEVWHSSDSEAPSFVFALSAGGTNGWNSTSVNSINAPAVTTTVAGARILTGVHIGSGSETVTPPSGSATVAIGGRRRGFMADRGTQASAGSSGAAAWGFGGAYEARAYQIALEPAASGPAPGAVSGASVSSLTDPAGRWVKGTKRISWFDGTNWAAILPTSTGHRLYTNLASPSAGTVVDARAGARPTTVYRDGWLGVLRSHPTQSRFSSYNTASSYAALVTDAVVPLTPASTDQSPVALARSANGHLWAAMVSGGNVTVTRSTDNGATWGTAQNVVTGWTLFPTGVVSILETGSSVVLLATGNDGAGRAALSIPQASASYAAASWTTESLPALASGAASDDHLSATVAPDGTIYAAAKTTNGATSTQLIYLLKRSTGGIWTSYSVEVGPDDDGGTSPGYTRPTVTLAYDHVVVAYGSIYAPQNVSYRTAPVSDLSTWSARGALLTSADYWDGAQTPPASSVRAGGAEFPVLAHNVDTGGITMAWLTSNNPTPPAVTYAIVGNPTSSGFTVSTKVTSGQSVRVKTGSTFGSAATPDADGWSKSVFTGLSAATLAAYDVEVTATDGFVTTIPSVGQGKTLPTAGAPANFTFGFGSCFDTLNGSLTTPNTGAFARLRARNPDLMFHLGDFTYADNVGSSQSSHRVDLEQVLSYSPALQDLVRDSATFYLKSDHDAGGGNNSAPGSWTAGNRAAALQTFSYPTRPDSNGLYYTVEVGRVLFIVTDTRYLVTSTSRLGTAQKAWFKEQMQRSHPVKVWVQEAAWIDNEPAEVGGDKWQDFAAEKSELGTFLSTTAVGQVLTIHGDQHALAADDGTNNEWGGFPSFCAAPFRNYTSIKTENYTDWSEGFHPNPVGAEQANHGFCTVTDTGEQITLALRGYDTSNTQRIAMDVVVSTAAPEPGDGPSVVVAGVEYQPTWTVVQGGVEVSVDWTVVQGGVESALT